MWLTAVLLGICQIVSFIGLYLLITMWADRKQRQIEARIDAVLREWLVPESEGKPHKLAQMVAALGEVVGTAAARSIMASINADKSHATRVANGLTEEIEGAQNPIMGLLAGGKRGKGAAVARLMELIAPMMGGNKGGGSNGHSDVSERIKHQS